MMREFILLKNLLIIAILAELLTGCDQIPPERFETYSPLIWTSDSKSELMLARKFLDIYEDKSANLTIEDIRKIEHEFVPAPSTIPVFPFTQSAIWSRLKLHHQSNESQQVYMDIEYSYFDHLSIFQFNQDGTLVKQWELGDTLPFDKRPIQDHSFVVPLQLKPTTSYNIYVRRDAQEAMFLVESLWSPAEYRERDRNEQLLAGIFYGAMLIMLVYNLLLYASTREITYLLYCIYLSLHALFLFAYRGYAFEYLWPAYPEIRSISLQILVPLAHASLTIFTQSYLNTKNESPKHHRYLWYLFWGNLLLTFLFPLLPHALAILLTTIIPPFTCIYLLVLGVLMWAQGNQGARYFILAFSVNLIAYIMTSSLIVMNPKLDLNLNAAVLIGGLVEIGVLLELVLLSIGVGYRMLLLRKEANELQKRNLEFQERAREALEQEVKSQTKELRSTVQTLKSTQQELLQQARLATVGNLVTGLAHEIGNPLNLTIGGAQELEDIIAESVATEPRALPKLMNKIKSCAGLITRGSERIEVIVRNLNQLAQAGDMPKQRSCEIQATLQATLELMGHRLGQENIKIQISETPTPRVKANSSELSQVILNLMLNACDAMENGGSIQIKVHQDDDHVQLDIIDSGPGVPKDIRENIFDAFYTTKESGTGLGLAISHQMVHDWGGNLTLEESESGAHFRLKMRIQANDS
ncbi:MAG: hypothetical protein HOK28_00715 [Deltaproteobacteria bacterium]|nr:hypothetical protein [Deltaproteobacteria bacterium]